MNNADQSQISTHNIKINILKPFLFTIIYFQFFFSKKLKNLWWDFGPLRVPGKYPTPRWGSFSVIDTTAFYNFINALTHSGY